MTTDDKNIQEFYISLANGNYKSIVMVLGAGISVSAGIPDFRSPGGLFEAVRTHFGEKFPDVMETPEHLLSRKFCSENPKFGKMKLCQCCVLGNSKTRNQPLPIK